VKKKHIAFLWIVFIFIIPLLFILFKYFFSDKEYIEFIIILAPYLFGILTIMYRIDINMYSYIKRILQLFSNNYTSWVLSIKYENINNYDKILIELQSILINKGYNVLKYDKYFLSVLWESKHIFNFRIENVVTNEYCIHLYTSKLDVPIKENEKKISDLCNTLETIENSIDMIDRNKKNYELVVYYPNSNPYYSYWVKTIPEEKIREFSCKIIIGNNDDIIDVNKNQIRINAISLSALFQKVKRYLTLREI